MHALKCSSCIFLLNKSVGCVEIISQKVLIPYPLSVIMDVGKSYTLLILEVLQIPTFLLPEA